MGIQFLGRNLGYFSSLSAGALLFSLSYMAAAQTQGTVNKNLDAQKSTVVSSQDPSKDGYMQRPLKVWPVGDSITVGATGSNVWNPFNGGYRRNLQLMLTNGYSAEFIGGSNWGTSLGDLSNWHSGYGGFGVKVFDKPEFTPESIKAKNPDAVLVLLGVNSIGHQKEYPDAQGQYWSVNGHKFNEKFFGKYREFIERLLSNSQATVFIAKLPPIDDSRYYQSISPWVDDINPNAWLTVGDGTASPKDILKEFNSELEAFYQAYYAANSRVVLVDINSGFTLGHKWEDDVAVIAPLYQWWQGDGLHPTYAGQRKIAERWNQAIREHFPTNGHLLYSLDCGANQSVKSMAAEGMAVGSAQSVVWDKPYGPDAVTQKKWGHLGVSSSASHKKVSAKTSLWLGWENTNTVYESVATSANDARELVYRFDVPVGGTYKISLGFHDTWADKAIPKTGDGGNPIEYTGRKAQIFIDGIDKGQKLYSYNDFGRRIYEVVNTTGSLEIKVVGVEGSSALLDSIAIQQIK